MKFAAVLAAAAACGLAAAQREVSFSHIRTATLSASDAATKYTVYSATYLSTPMDLASGEMVFTQAKDTPLTMPDPLTTGYAILGFSGEIVDANNVSVPLSEVYDHHWTASAWPQALAFSQSCSR